MCVIARELSYFAPYLCHCRRYVITICCACSEEMDVLCDVFVRPLACTNRDDLWEQRWPAHAHLQALKEALDLSFFLHDVYGAYTATSFTDTATTAFHMLYNGSHYELLYT